MTITLFKEFKFEAAHYLPNISKEHKCAKLHGHSFLICIEITGNINYHTGWVMDFSSLKKIFQPIHDQLDHSCLNEIIGLENPTTEILAKWIWDKLKPKLPLLSAIIINETCTSGCKYIGI